MRNNSVVIDTTHCIKHFPHLTMQVKTASSETTTKPQPVITDDALTIPPTTTKIITAFFDHPSKWNTTGIVTLLEKFTETANLLICHSMSTIIDKRIAVRVTNTTESPYPIEKHTQIAKFSVVTPDQSKHIKPVDMAILSMIPQGDPNLTAYLNELLRTNKTWPAKQHILVPKTWKSCKAWESYPNTDKNPQRIKWTQRQRETQSKREHRISKQNSQTVWLDWHFLDRNRKASSRRHSGRLSWLFRQTQNGCWDEHGIQEEINPQGR